jgi:hypothetical protein
MRPMSESATNTSVHPFSFLIAGFFPNSPGTRHPRVPATQPGKPNWREVDNSIPGKRQGVDEQQYDTQRSYRPPNRYRSSHTLTRRLQSTPNAGHIPRRPTSRHNTITHRRPTTVQGHKLPMVATTRTHSDTGRRSCPEEKTTTSPPARPKHTTPINSTDKHMTDLPTRHLQQHRHTLQRNQTAHARPTTPAHLEEENEN